MCEWNGGNQLMVLFRTLLVLIAMLSKPAQAAGFHETSFDLITAGTVYFGVSPIFSSSTFKDSMFTSWGYQATAGFDHSFMEGFGARGYVSYARTTGNNTANTNTTFEKVSMNDFELGVMGTFSGWALGGGIMPRSSSFDYVNGQTTVSNSYSGMLKFAKASLDFTSQGGRVGFSISESYIFGNVGDTTVLKVTEFRTLLHIFYLLNLK